jgi:hypothetical protein
MSVIWSRKDTLDQRRLRSSNLNVTLPLMELVYAGSQPSLQDTTPLL